MQNPQKLSKRNCLKLHLEKHFNYKNDFITFETFSQDGGIGRHTVSPRTTKKTTTI